MRWLCDEEEKMMMMDEKRTQVPCSFLVAPSDRSMQLPRPNSRLQLDGGILIRRSRSSDLYKLSPPIGVVSRAQTRTRHLERVVVVSCDI